MSAARTSPTRGRPAVLPAAPSPYETDVHGHVIRNVLA